MSRIQPPYRPACACPGRRPPGAPADLVVWSGDPLELSTRAEAVIVAGEVVPNVSRQTRLRDRYRRLPTP